VHFPEEDEAEVDAEFDEEHGVPSAGDPPSPKRRRTTGEQQDVSSGGDPSDLDFLPEEDDDGDEEEAEEEDDDDTECMETASVPSPPEDLRTTGPRAAVNNLPSFAASSMCQYDGMHTIGGVIKVVPLHD
jgi:hypothetical protein